MLDCQRSSRDSTLAANHSDATMANSDVEDRLKREAQFHDQRFGHKPVRSRALKLFRNNVGLRAVRETYDVIRPLCPGARVLDYGCSFGQTSFSCLRFGAASTEGIDISAVAINKAQQEAVERGLSSARFEAMNAEEMTFGDDEFDLVCGIGILHHLDLRKSLGEISRVLKPSGTAVFLEPMGHNPVINLVRNLTPRLRTPDEHPLTMTDVELAGEFFGAVEPRFVNLTTLATIPFAMIPGMQHVVRLFGSVDDAVFWMAPSTRKLAWNVVLRLSKPR